MIERFEVGHYYRCFRTIRRREWNVDGVMDFVIGLDFVTCVAVGSKPWFAAFKEGPVNTACSDKCWGWDVRDFGEVNLLAEYMEKRKKRENPE